MSHLPAQRLPRFALAGCILLAVLATLPLLIFETASIGLWLMQIIPLSLTTAGVYRIQKRALQWLGFLVMFFLMQGILQLFVPLPAYRLLGAATSLTSIGLFILVILSIRRPPASESDK